MNILDLLEKESKEQKKLITGALLLTAVDACTQIILLVLFYAAISSDDSRALISVKFLIALLLQLIASNKAKKMITALIARITTTIRERIIRKIRKIELRTYEKINKPYIYNTLTFDVATIFELAEVIFWQINAAIVCILCLIYLAYLSSTAFLLTIFCIIVASFTYLAIKNRIKKSVVMARNNEQHLFDDITHLFDGFKELKINDKKNDDFFHSSCKKNIDKVKVLRTKVGYTIANGIIATHFFWFMVIFCTAFVLPLSGYISKEVLGAVFSIILFMPFVLILNDMSFITLANISVDRIYNMEKELDRLDEEETDSKEQEERRKQEIQSFEKINYNHLIFDYTDKHGSSSFTIGPVDLTIDAGEILFITGGNGSGKSTLLKLITGLYFPLSGSIEIDGKKAGVEELRNLFSPIFTDPHLFDRLYGLDHIDSEKVDELLEKMELSSKTQFIEDRFTELDLSTGQRKRLALISALLEDRPIYLFDEWAAEQAPNFRQYFYEVLLPSLKAENKTIIAVTHDDHYFHAADRIVTLDYGEIKSYSKS